jgi:thioredoxin-related protein
MRAICILLVFILTVSWASAGDGIDFLTENYPKAVSTAKVEKKLMLLDFTASWCFPCKKMEREVFPDAALGEFVNEQFISFKVNADYFWGMDIADEFKVKAYPTILIVDQNGKVVKRIVGYQTAESLLAELKPLSDFNRLFTSD